MAHSAGLRKEAAIRMAISTPNNVLAGRDGKLDPSMSSTARCYERYCWCTGGRADSAAG